LSRDLNSILSSLSGTGHRGGTFMTEVLADLLRILPERPRITLETGCGKSTIIFSNIAEKHYVFAYDDRHLEDSSVLMVHKCSDFNNEATTFVYGPTQHTLSNYKFPEGEYFDIVLLDGPHGYPFPDYEYALLYQRLREGSILIIDDIHIPSIGNMFDTLRVDRMYNEIGVYASTGVLRRTGARGVPSDGDHWYEQQYNVAQFPRPMEKYHPDRRFESGKVISLSAPNMLGRYGRRGLEKTPGEECVQTTDLSSTLGFTPRDSQLKFVTIDLEYKTIYKAAARDALVNVGETSHLLIEHNEFETRRFRFPLQQEKEILLTLLHPNASPEHDLGIKRYEFRRLGTKIKSIIVHLSEEVLGPLAKESVLQSTFRHFNKLRV